MTKKDDEDFQSSTKCWICENSYAGGDDVKLRNYCQITGKYRGSAHRVFNIKVKLNRKTLIVFHNLKNYDSDLIVQELSKFNFKINLTQNRLEKYMGFSVY